jgi:hypothetical protein
MTLTIAIPPQKHPDEFYIDVALNHHAFQQMAASAAIEDIYFNATQTIEAGRYIAGEIDYEQWTQIISKRHGIASSSP